MEQRRSKSVADQEKVEVPPGIEPGNGGFADVLLPPNRSVDSYWSRGVGPSRNVPARGHTAPDGAQMEHVRLSSWDVLEGGR